MVGANLSYVSQNLHYSFNYKNHSHVNFMNMLYDILAYAMLNYVSRDSYQLSFKIER